jgi:soluble lytic murein transglycosylase-like protein
MPSFGTVALPALNPLFDLASVDKNVNVINSGRLANQLASNTLDSNTQIAANTAESGGLANQLATQKNPLEIAGMRQQLGLDPSPTLDKLQTIYNGGNGQPAAAPSDGSAPQGQSMLSGPMPISVDPQTQADVGAEATAQGVNPAWAMRVHNAESGASKEPFGPGTTSSAGAIGPMQLMPDTAKGLGVDPTSYSGNIKGGVAYLGQMKARYDSPVLATAAYNAGPQRVDDFLAGKSGLPPETIAYVGKVFGTNGSSILNAALTGAHGHNIPGAAVPQPQTAAAPAQPGVALAPDGSASPPPGPQTATRGPIPGQPATDAIPAIAAPTPSLDANGQPIAPGTQGVSDVMARLRNATPAPQPAATLPPVANPNSLLSVASPDGSAPQAPLNSLASAPVQPTPVQPTPVSPPAAPLAQPGTGMNSPQVQQAQDLIRRATQIEMAAAATPNDPRAKATAAAMAADLRGRAAVIMQADSVTVAPNGVQTHTLTGKQDNAATPAMNYQPDPNNPGVLSSPGQKPVVLPPGRPFPVEGQGAYVVGPGGVVKQAVTPDLPAIAGQKAAESQGSGTGSQAVTQAGDLVKMGRAADTAIGNIDYGLNQLNEAKKGGLPSGYFSPGVASAAAALKAMGLTLPGVKPEAVSDIQTAQKTLAVVGGAILQNTIGKDSQITDGKISAFIHTQPGIELDPDAIPRILNWARSQFVYEREMSMAGMQVASKNSGMLPLGWQAGYFSGKGSFAPIYDPLSGEMKQPDGQAPSRQPPAEAAPAPQAAPTPIPAAADRVPGHTYPTPRGLMNWTGTGWLPAGQ